MFPILLCALFLADPTDGSSGWPQYNGASSDRTARTFTGPSSLSEESWRVSLRDGFSSFVVGAGRVFTLVGEPQDGKVREVLLALDEKSGQELWRASMGQVEYDGGGGRGTDDNDGGDGPRTTPSIVDGRVYVLDAELGLYCLEAETGKPLWSHDIQEEFSGRTIRWQNGASPLVEGELVFVVGGGAGEALLAFDRFSGEVAWARGDEQMTHATPVAVTIQGKRQVIFFVQSGLIAVEPESGDELWRTEFPYRTSSAASPVVSGDIVYCSAGYGVGAAAWRIEAQGDALVPTLLWRASNKLINHWSTPVVKDGHLYGMFSFKDYGDGPLKCVELATGEERWAQEGFGPGNCILVGDILVALSDAGEVVLVDAQATGYRELWRADVLEGKCWSMPAFSDGALFVRSTREGVRLDLYGAKR